MDEKIDVSDAYGKLTGEVVMKSAAHAQGIWHHTAHIWVYKQNKDILLQRRALDKPDNPGKWSESCAGHLTAGDTLLEGAVRELHEELGITARPEDLTKVCVMKKTFDSGDFHDREFVHIYVLPYSGEDIVLQEEEVMDSRWIRAEEFLKELRDPKTKDKYIQFETYYEDMAKYITNI